MNAIYVLADLHIGKYFPFKYDSIIGTSKRTLDLLNPLNFLEQTAQENDTIIIVGDLYDSNLVNATIRLMTSTLLESIASKNITIHIIGGNHDTPDEIERGSPLDDLRFIKNVFIHKTIESFFIDEIAFLTIPFISISYISRLLQVKHQKSIESEHLNELCLLEIRKKIEKEAEKLVKLNKKWLVALPHFYIQDAVLSNDYILQSNEFVLPSDVFNSFNLILAGHVHKPQKIGNNIVYLGSTSIINFSESDEKKRMIKINENNGQYDLSTIIIKDRPHIIIEFDYHNESANILNEAIKEKILEQETMNGAIIKLVCKCKNEHREFVLNSINYDLFKDSFHVFSPNFIEEGSETGFVLNSTTSALSQTEVWDEYAKTNKLEEKIRLAGKKLIEGLLQNET